MAVGDLCAVAISCWCVGTALAALFLSLLLSSVSLLVAVSWLLLLCLFVLYLFEMLVMLLVLLMSLAFVCPSIC